MAQRLPTARKTDVTDPTDPTRASLPEPTADAPVQPPGPPPPAHPEPSTTSSSASTPDAEGGTGFAVPTVPVAATARRASSGGYGRWLVVVLIPVFAIVAFAGGVAAGTSGLFGGATAVVSSPAPTTGDASLDLIEEAWLTIHQNYVDAANLDDRELAYGAIRGLTEAVGDEGHTSFLTAEESAAVDQSLSGTFVGIGVQVGRENEGTGPVINSIIPNTPAAASELKRGDRIVAVDGWKTEGQTVDEVVSHVRGPEGEAVTLTIARDGVADFEVTIVRRKFDLPLVSWSMVPGRDIAVIRLEQFATGATKGIEAAITGARGEGATAIILDLRGNPGGYVNEAIGVASQFVGDGIVYQSIDASGKTEKVAVERGGLATDIPLVVLANGDSASSAEIVTGAIQDAGRGTVVGEKTFGTGTVLGRFDLSDGSSMRIGVERWVTRNGRPIWREGLEPDVKVVLPETATPLFPDDLRDLSAADLAKSTDVQLLRALDELKGKG
jgi:carboxyl-terminal processing protease